jgi:limonene-1,2-epoxide hydrolase
MSPVEIAGAFTAAIEAKDVDAAVALAADDISYENTPTDPVVGIFEVDGHGRVALWRDYFDMASCTRQFAELTA